MKEGKCPHCGKEPCYEHCYANDTGKHEVAHNEGDRDWMTTFTWDNGSMIVEFECRYCGQGGSARLEPSDVQWE